MACWAAIKRAADEVATWPASKRGEDGPRANGTFSAAAEPKAERG